MDAETASTIHERLQISPSFIFQKLNFTCFVNSCRIMNRFTNSFRWIIKVHFSKEVEEKKYLNIIFTFKS